MLLLLLPVFAVLSIVGVVVVDSLVVFAVLLSVIAAVDDADGYC